MSETECHACKATLRWDADSQAWVDRFDSEMCTFFDLDDVHTTFDAPPES